MSRSGYTDDYDDGGGRLALYRGTVASATRGKRGQEFFKALVVALDALPEKKLITHELQTTEGNVCAIGALGKQRAIDMTELDPENPIAVGDTFNIAECLAREVVYMNDEWATSETPEARWSRMREWAQKQISAKSPKKRRVK